MVEDNIGHMTFDPEYTIWEADSSQLTVLLSVHPTALKGKTMHDILFDEETWKDERKIKELQKQVEFGPHHAFCETGTGNKIVRSDVFYISFDYK